MVNLVRFVMLGFVLERQRRLRWCDNLEKEGVAVVVGFKLEMEIIVASGEKVKRGERRKWEMVGSARSLCLSIIYVCFGYLSGKDIDRALSALFSV